MDDYTADHGKNSVSVTESRVEDKKAYLTLKYEDVEIFSDFTGIECFSGSIVQSGGSAIVVLILGTALDKMGYKKRFANGI